jgi:hypothetical protein
MALEHEAAQDGGGQVAMVQGQASRSRQGGRGDSGDGECRDFVGYFVGSLTKSREIVVFLHLAKIAFLYGFLF